MVILYPPLKLNMQISADALALEDAELSRLRVWVRPVLEHRISSVSSEVQTVAKASTLSDDT